MSSPADRLERRVLDAATARSRLLLGVVAPLVFVAVILTADLLEGPKTAYVGVLAAVPMLAAVFGSLRMVLFVAGATWLSAFAFGHLASDGNVTAQNVRLVIIALLSLLAIGSTELRLRREARYAEALVLTAEAKSLERAAQFDMLTGLLNRRGFFAAADRRQGARAALAVIDIDGLKQINDERGHPAGGAVIAAVAKRLKAQFRDVDLVARWGGDEFLIRIEAPPTEALLSLRRAVAAIGANPVRIDDDQVPVSLSAGIAVWEPDAAFDEVYRVADARMYSDKQGTEQITLPEA